MTLSSTALATLLTALLLLAAPHTGLAAAYQDSSQPFYQVNFNAPLAHGAFSPDTGGTAWPSALAGNPQVIPAVAALGQPLLLNTELGNGPCCYQEEIAFEVDTQADQFVIAFDLLTARLVGSRNQFRVLLNDADEAALSFSNEGMVLWSGGGAIAGYVDHQLVHVQLTLDRTRQTLSLRINGETVHTAPTATDGLRAVRFNMASADGMTPEQIDPEPFAALDNIVISNGSYRYVNLQTSIGQSTQRDESGLMEFSVQVRNRSEHTAHDLVLTHLLPAGVEFVAAHSDQLTCQPVRDQVLCKLVQLGGLEQASVMLSVRSTRADQWLEFTSIAVSNDEEIDNADNQGKARLGGSAGLLMLIGVLLLLYLRRI